VPSPGKKSWHETLREKKSLRIRKRHYFGRERDRKQILKHFSPTWRNYWLPTKMAAAVKGLQLVKPHVKRISFPARSGVIPKWTGQSVAPPAAAAVSPSAAAAPMSFKSPMPSSFAGDSLPTPPWPQVGALPRGGGVAYGDLPAKYKRRTISDAEIDAILSGGADWVIDCCAFDEERTPVCRLEFAERESSSPQLVGDRLCYFFSVFLHDFFLGETLYRSYRSYQSIHASIAIKQSRKMQSCKPLLISHIEIQLFFFSRSAKCSIW